MEITRIAFTFAWGLLILIGSINIAMIFYAVQKKLEPLERHFERWDSAPIYNGESFNGKIIRLAAISVLISSKKNQNQDPTLKMKIQCLPKELRFWAMYPFHIAYFVSSTSIALWLYGKYSGLMK
jgi:hypothetical protein